jgi:phosphotransferase system, enzyme I, PtsP
MNKEPALRSIMRRLREIMAEPGDGQSRLDKIVLQISGLMVAEVCSIYVKRQDGSLELFATEGLNRDAVHNTRMNRGEGLVGRCAEMALPVNEPDAQHHPAFSYRPETGEDIYHSLLAVPILRGGVVYGVLVVQNRTFREYSEEDVEVLQTTAMVITEHLIAGAIAGVGPAADVARTSTTIITGETMAEGIALGHIVLHEPRVVVTKLLADNPLVETERLEVAVKRLKDSLDDMLEHETLSKAGAHRDVLETYRMFANDKGWLLPTLPLSACRIRRDSGCCARTMPIGARECAILTISVTGCYAFWPVGRRPRTPTWNCRRIPFWWRATWGQLSCSTMTGPSCAA